MDETYKELLLRLFREKQAEHRHSDYDSDPENVYSAGFSDALDYVIDLLDLEDKNDE